MPLFGTQIFLAEAEVDTIYCRQYIRCAYRHTRGHLDIGAAIYCNGYNEENQVSENQYFHAARAYS